MEFRDSRGSGNITGGQDRVRVQVAKLGSRNSQGSGNRIRIQGTELRFMEQSWGSENRVRV